MALSRPCGQSSTLSRNLSHIHGLWLNNLTVICLPPRRWWTAWEKLTLIQLLKTPDLIVLYVYFCNFILIGDKELSIHIGQNCLCGKIMSLVKLWNLKKEKEKKGHLVKIGHCTLKLKSKYWTPVEEVFNIQWHVSDWIAEFRILTTLTASNREHGIYFAIDHENSFFFQQVILENIYMWSCWHVQHVKHTSQVLVCNWN